MRTERIYAFDKNGKLISHSTSGTGSNTQLVEGHDYTDTIMTHNHPGNYFEGRKNLATRIGTSFSANDIIVATAHNVKEMRAVTRQGYTYSIKRKGDKWHLANKPAAWIYLKNRYDDLYEHTARKYRKALWKRTDGTDDKYESLPNDIMTIHAGERLRTSSITPLATISGLFLTTKGLVLFRPIPYSISFNISSPEMRIDFSGITPNMSQNAIFSSTLPKSRNT